MSTKAKKDEGDGIYKNKDGDWVYYQDAWPWDKERHVEMTYIIDGHIPRAFALEIGEREWYEKLRYYERMKYDDEFRKEEERKKNGSGSFYHCKHNSNSL